MTDRPENIIFHVGAHKTATTHLQRCLQRVSGQLQGAGVAYRGPADLRLPGQSLPARFGLTPKEPAQPDPAAALAEISAGAARLVLSEENYIGPLLRPLRGGRALRYGEAGARLAQLANAMGQEIAVCLAIRQPLRFLDAAYSQSLMAGKIMPHRHFAQRNPVTAVRWAEVVAAIGQAKGVSGVTLWRYEDYQPVFAQITQALLGPAAAHVTWVDRHIHRSLSATAVAAVLHDDSAGAEGLTAQAARDLFPVSADHPAFTGFSPEAYAAADQTYAETCEKIAQMPGVTFLRPPAHQS